jgi:3-deoxy-D-manno-octulosonic-acid transferase
VKLLYQLFIFLYPKIAWLISGNNAKAKLWLKGREKIFTHLAASFQNNLSPVIWVHCSSLGEFEQGRPLIESLKEKYPDHKTLVTFFSPSGFEVRKNYEKADWVYYLPMDSYHHAKKFFTIVQPSLILFVKYEFWYYYLREAKKRNIPILLISGIFRKGQPFFAWYGNFHRQMLLCFTHLFVQNELSVELLKSIGLHKNVTISGDTRFDRVIEIAEQFQPIEIIDQFIGNSKVIVAGSTWTEDDEELDHYANTHREIKFIIAPHEIEAERIKECLTFYKYSILFSDLTSKNAPDISSTDFPNVLIIDNIGLLSKLYHYATVCYVGGAFGEDGVHNVLEAAVYNKPVVFGPVYDKYLEAVELVDAGGGFPLESALELEKLLDNLLTNNMLYQQSSTLAGNYVKNKAGATRNILHYIQENRLIIN